MGLNVYCRHRPAQALHAAGNGLQYIFDKIHTITLLLSCSRGQRVITSILAEYSTNVVNLHAILQAAHIFQTHDDPLGCAEHGDYVVRNVMLGALGLTLINSAEVFKSVHWMKIEEQAALCSSGCCSKCCGEGILGYTRELTGNSYNPDSIDAQTDSSCKTFFTNLSVALGTLSRATATSAATFNSISLIQGIDNYEACPIPAWYFIATSVAFGLLIMPYKVLYLAKVSMKPCIAIALTICYGVLKNVPIMAAKFSELFLEITQKQTEEEDTHDSIVKGGLFAAIILLALTIFIRSQVAATQNPTNRGYSLLTDNASADPRSSWRKAADYIGSHYVAGTIGWLTGTAVGKFAAMQSTEYTPANPSEIEATIYWPVCVFSAYMVYMVTYFRVYAGLKLR